MILLLLLVAAFATLCRFLGWRRIAWCVGGFVFALLLASGYGWLPRRLLHDLQDGYTAPMPADFSARNLIILLGGGTERLPDGSAQVASLAQSRLLKSLDLYRACRLTGADCAILVSGGDARRHGTSEAAVYAQRLLGLGVAAPDLLREDRSMNTWQNAQFSRSIALQFKPDRVFLVSSAVHLRRSIVYFTHFGFDVIPIASDYLGVISGSAPQSYNLALTDMALHEYVGLARFRFYNAMGWNAPREEGRIPLRSP